VYNFDVYFVSLGKGIPNNLAANSAAASVDAVCFPSAPTAANWYACDMGSALTAESVFAQDPFATEASKTHCFSNFGSLYPDMQHLLSATVNGDMVPLQQSLLTFIDLARLHSN